MSFVARNSTLGTDLKVPFSPFGTLRSVPNVLNTGDKWGFSHIFPIIFDVFFGYLKGLKASYSQDYDKTGDKTFGIGLKVFIVDKTHICYDDLGESLIN